MNLAKRDIYQIEGNILKRTRRECPKCGRGVFLAVHKDRISCGKCSYTEFKKKVEEKPAPKGAKVSRGTGDDSAPSLTD